MKSMILKKYAKLFVKAAVVITILSCSGGYYMEEEDIYFFTPELSGDLTYAPFFRTYHGFYQSGDDGNLSDFDDVNIAEWKSYLGEVASSEDIRYVLYEANNDQILRWSLGQKSPDEVKWNSSSIQQTSKKKRQQFLKYLEITRRCNVELNYVQYYWWSDNGEDSIRQENLKTLRQEESGKEKLFKDPFVKQRYHFTMLRLLFELEDYNQCEAYYSKNIEPLRKQGGASIDYRSRGYVAGALKRTGKVAEGNYIFSQLYDQCPEMQLTAMTSFGFKDESELTATIALAKSNREREVIWQLVGIKYDAARAIDEIYKINPKSTLIDVLLTRLVNIKEEEYIWRSEELESPLYWEWDTEEIFARNTNSDIVAKVADENKVTNQALWNLCAGYLCVLQNEHARGESYFKKTEGLTKDATMLQELRIFRFVSRLLSQQTDDAVFDDYVAKEMKWLWSNPEVELRTAGLRVWSEQILRAHYNRHNYPELAEAMYSDKEEYYLSSDNLDNMIAFMEKEKFSPIEEFALETYELKLGNLYDLKGIFYFYDDNLSESLKWFEKAGFGESSYGDPFVIHINDCHDCDHREEWAERYSKIEFIKRLIQLKNEMGINPALVSRNSYLLANAYYNATYYGNYRDFYYNAIFYDWNYYTPSSNDDEEGIYSSLEGMPMAMKYYQDALEASSDQEFKAECVFMLAKCEQNIYFKSGQSDYECPSSQGCDFIAGNYFRELEREYGGTAYFQQVLQECGYFATYMKSK